eukprot:GHVN01088331.1.p1 GENE.GHVN01088331.1~~GHVN01088331.1.p1  ORF type:complete len:131 (+),score=30.80 GHVN01088331.1:216-608(+)
MAEFTIEIRKKMENRLLDRKQLVFEVLHPGKRAATMEEVREFLKKEFKATGDRIVIHGIKTHFGGSRTTGFARIYDTLEQLKKMEEKYILARMKLDVHEKKGRKQRKEKKNKAKRLRGKKKADFLYGKKK